MGQFFFPISFIRQGEKVIQDLKSKSIDGEIPARILKESDFTFDFLKNCINKSIEDSSFQDSLQEANGTKYSRMDQVKLVQESL